MPRTDLPNGSEVGTADHTLPGIFAIDFDIARDGIDIGREIDSVQRESLLNIVNENYVNWSNIPEIDHNYEMEVRLTSEVPFHYSPRRLSAHDKTKVREIISDLQAQGIIRPSDSPYASPIVLVKKKDGSTATRMCVDYRTLNGITLRDNFPLPLIEDCLEYLEGKQYFSVLDLKNGFHQVRVSDASIKFTSVVTPMGQFEYVRMPFGMKNAPAVFQRFITKVLRPLIDDGSIIVYIDDILIATSDLESHLRIGRRKNIGRVLRRLSEFRLRLNMKKCQFCYTEIEYLGYLVDSRGIRPSGRHVENIRSYPTRKIAGI